MSWCTSGACTPAACWAAGLATRALIVADSPGRVERWVVSGGPAVFQLGMFSLLVSGLWGWVWP